VPIITTTTAAPKIVCPGCTNYLCWGIFDDFLVCNELASHRSLQNSDATSLTIPLLTYSSGSLSFTSNPFLQPLSVPSLTFVLYNLNIESNSQMVQAAFSALKIVRGAFRVRYNGALLELSVPALTYIGGALTICQNSPGFLVPSAPPSTPLGGLVVTGSHKGTFNCVLQDGTDFCGSAVICP
jgi:hypothetical protein